MATLVDDVGSFPLPANMDSKLFEEAYRTARKALTEGKHLEKDEFLLNNFNQVVLDSFMKKVETGLNVVNYPQHYDMHRQMADTLRESMNEGTYLIGQERAVLPEVQVISGEAKRLKWTDVDPERKIITCNDPEKGSNPRIFNRLTGKLLSMLNALPRKPGCMFVFGDCSLNSLKATYTRARRRLAIKLQNPRLLEIHFHT
jgi:hypothetical protein